MGEQGRVLIVEDDEAIRRLMAEVLAVRGYEVHEVGDGLAALGAALTLRPDVILLDIGLPGLDGFGVLAQLAEHAETRDVPVVMVTAWAEPELVTKALDRGAFDYVRKPFDLADFGARVDAAARSRVRTDLVEPLTGLVNRTGLEAELGRRSGRPFAVVAVDCDLEGIRSTFGDDVHDEALRAVSRRVAARVRGTDVLGRWDGARLIVVLPGTPSDGASVLAADLARLVESSPLDTTSAAVRVSASSEVLEFAGETHAEVVERLDRQPVAA